MKVTTQDILDELVVQRQAQVDNHWTGVTVRRTRDDVVTLTMFGPPRRDARGVIVYDRATFDLDPRLARLSPETLTRAGSVFSLTMEACARCGCMVSRNAVLRAVKAAIETGAEARIEAATDEATAAP